MKKILLVILLIAMCVSICSCGGTNSSLKSDPNSSLKSNPNEPILDIEQELVNICCSYSKCSSVSLFEIGTKNKIQIDNGYKVSAKGSYYPVDSYGDLGDKMLFDIIFTATWDGKSSFYDITVNSKTISKKKY